MSETTPEPRHFTPEEYFLLEDAATERHEYFDGRINLMSGGTDSHSVICSNVNAAFHNALRNTPCRPMDPNIQIRYGKRARFGYADCSVVCGPRIYDPSDPRHRTLLNPTLIVEVLSPGTEKFDRGMKLALYREIESFREYIVVSQEEPSIETYFRQSDGTWRFASYVSLEATVPIDSLQMQLRGADVYADVLFPAAPDIGPQADKAP